MKKQIEQVLDSKEVAEMIGKEHKNLVRDIRSYLEEFLLLKNQESDSRLKIEPSDFFIEDTYTKRGKEYPSFKITKKGCEFTANKLTGVKGTEFTARYINRFHDMDDVIQTGIPQKKEKPKAKNLSSTNMLVKTVSDIFTRAGVSPLFIAAETKRLYKEEAGIDINIPLITDKATMPKLYDNTEMAKELGVLSSAGNPHSQAIGAILKKLHIPESDIVTTAFSRNGHDDVTIQYKLSVFEDVKTWLMENGYPTKISYTDSKGNPKTCTVVYREVA